MLIDHFSPPLPDELLINNNFFDMYPFDGGGYFINAAIAGTIDDEKYAAKLLNGALDDFGGLNSLCFDKFERWRSIEKSCWINRCYFLVPLAKLYWLNGDEQIAETVKNIMLNFVRNYPAPSSEKAMTDHWQRVLDNRNHNYNEATKEQIIQNDSDTEYVWFDFQPASRIIHFLYAMHFLRKSSSISSAEWVELENAIDCHAHIIAVVERDVCQLNRGNHQSLRGLALLYAATFLKDKPNAAMYLNKGIEIINYHIQNDFHPDGVLKELSPSYHMFETWHIRDALLLKESYSLKLCPEINDVLSRAVSFAFSIRQPDGKSTVINDGYSLNLDAYLKSFPKSITAEFATLESSYFPDAGIATYYNEQFYLCLDASQFTGKYSHYHAGKNGVTLFAMGKPFFIDSGCCSYDDELFSKYKQTNSHNSMLINQQGDGYSAGIYDWKCWSTINSNDWNDRTIDSTLKSSSGEWQNVEWTRSIKIAEVITICDEVIIPCEKNIDFLYNLHPDVDVELNNDDVTLKHDDVILILKYCSDVPFKIYLEKGVAFVNDTHQENLKIRYNTTAPTSFKVTFTITIK